MSDQFSRQCLENLFSTAKTMDVNRVESIRCTKICNGRVNLSLLRIFRLFRIIRSWFWRISMATSTFDPISLPASQEEQVHALRKLLRREGKARLTGKGGEPSLELPDAVYELLLRILDGMQQGKAISIVPVTQDLTTQQAAGLLGVSRPFFVKLLESGKIPYHLTGTHRRVYLKDLMTYKEHRDRERRDTLDQMAQEAEELGLYDKVLLPDE